MKSFAEVIRSIQFRGWRSTMDTARYTRLKARMDRHYRRQHPAWEKLTSPASPPGSLVQAQPVPRGGSFQFENATLEIIFFAEDLARLSWGPEQPPVPYALAEAEWSEVEVPCELSAQGWQLTTSRLHVLVKPDGGIRFHTPSGELLREELPPKQRGEFWVHQARLAPEEAISGLGEQAGRLNLRGKSFHLWNTDPGGSYGPGKEPLYMPVPVYLGLHRLGSYLVFFENYHPAVFSFGLPETESTHENNVDGGGADPESAAAMAEARFEGGMLRYYFIPGPPAVALERYTQLTGRPPLPPRWAFGYHQSRWGYTSASAVREVAAGFQQHNLPVSAIHIDIDYMDEFRVFTVDEQRFPDLANFAQELSTAGIRLVTILNPGVKVDPDYAVFAEGQSLDVFCKTPDGQTLIGLVWPGPSVFPDFTNPAARQWWGSQYPTLLEQGVSGFWHDMNEPTSFSAGDMTLPLATRHSLDGQAGDHRAGHNLYAFQMNRAGYEALRSLRPEQRAWIISRSGWAGQQRYAWNWTGDIESTWAALRMTIPTILGMGLSGFALTGPDIGGFSGNPTAELYLRHLQMAAFLPFFRTHSAVSTERREPWVYGEPYTNIIRQYMELRYRLVPYLYTLAWEASQTGVPLVRPVFWDDPQNPKLWEVDDIFCLGNALLIAPVVEENARLRKVHLPGGSWFDFWDDQSYSGTGELEIEVTLEKTPVLVRARSVLPSTLNHDLVLDIYPDEAGFAKGIVYSDAGDGFGSSRLDHFEFTPQEGSLSLTWKTVQANAIDGTGRISARDSSELFPFPYSGLLVRMHGKKVHAAWIDGQFIEPDGNQIRTAGFHEIRFDVQRGD